MRPDDLAELQTAMHGCEDACRALSAACMDVTTPEVKTAFAVELLSRAIDVAYVAGATARVLARASVMADDTIVMQLGACERIADGLADFCDETASTSPVSSRCFGRAIECATRCASLRDRFTHAGTSRPRRWSTGDGSAA